MAAAAAAALLAILLVLVPLGIAFGQTPPGYTPEQVHASRDRVLNDSRYQTQPPEPETLPDIEPLRIPPWLAKTVFWVVVAAVAALVLFFLGNLLLDLARNRGVFKSNRAAAPDGPVRVETPLRERRGVDHRTLAEADRLAGEGRFSEAIHLLLLVAMDRLHRELGPRVAPAMTSREVLRLPVLPGATVAPLTRMVQLSEINHFGGRLAGEPDYHRCRDDFLRFSGEAPVAA